MNELSDKEIERILNQGLTEDDLLVRMANEIVERRTLSVLGNALLSGVAYEKCQLVARKEQVYTADGKFMFSVSMTNRARALLDNDGWEKEKESWLDYRQRTVPERELEKQKQYKLAADLADAFNKMHGNFP